MPSDRSQGVEAAKSVFLRTIISTDCGGALYATAGLGTQHIDMSEGVGLRCDHLEKRNLGSSKRNMSSGLWVLPLTC